jgi:acetolactate synthase I/II/III large subunit
MAKMSAAEYMARTLDVYGVEQIFFVPTILSRTLYEIEKNTSISRIMTHGEKAAAYMADGYARASRKPGVCMAQIVGAANLAAGLRDPYLANSPVVAFTGGTYEHSYGRNYYQEIDDFPFFPPVTKFSQRVNHGGRLPDLLAQAFRAAVSGKPGPTHLQVLGHAGDILENQTVDAEIPRAPIALAAHRAEPSDDAIDAAIGRLVAARRPVIVAGGGARFSGAGPSLLRLAERLAVPVATSLNAKDVIPAGHPLAIGVPGLYSRASANQVILEADLVFYVGSKTGSQVTFNWRVPQPGTPVIHLDIDDSEFGRHYPDTIGLLGDAKAGLDKILARLPDSAVTEHEPWLARVAAIGRAWTDEWAASMQSDQVPIRPERLLAELNSCLPSDALVVSDTGHAGMWTGGFLDLDSPDQEFIRAAGSLGWGLPAAIGAQLADRSRPVVLFTGDGGLWYHIAELETAARWKIPVTVVVNNNRSLNQEITPYEEAYGGRLHGRHGELWHFSEVDFAAVAASMGVQGFNVDRAGEFPSALAEAVETPGPALISVQTDMEIMAPKASAQRFLD